MLSRIAYLDFAARWYDQVEFDLATSGLAKISADALGPPPAVDDMSGRERFAAALDARYGVSPNQVVPALGASGAALAIFAACFERGARVLIESPGYEPLVRVPELCGLAIDRFKRRFERGYSLDLEMIRAELTPSTRAVVVSNPHNPSGVFVPDSELTALASALAERGVLLVVDEVYRELAAPGSSARRLGDNVLAFSSLTKCWGAPWARAGWALVPADCAALVQHVERYVVGLAPPIVFGWGAQAIERADRLLARAAEIQAGKRELIDAFVEAHRAALEWVPPHRESPFGFVRDRRGLSTLSRIERGVAESGVIVAPGEFFDAPGGFRLSWTAERAKLEEGLRRLASVLSLGS